MGVLNGPSLVSLKHDGKQHHAVRIAIDWNEAVTEGQIISLPGVQFQGNQTKIDPQALGPAGHSLALKTLIYSQSFGNFPPNKIGSANFSGQGGELFIYCAGTGSLLTIPNPVNTPITPVPAFLTPAFLPTVSEVSGVMSFANSDGGVITIAKMADDFGTASTSGISVFTFVDFELPTWSIVGSGLAMQDV